MSGGLQPMPAERSMPYEKPMSGPGHRPENYAEAPPAPREDNPNQPDMASQEEEQPMLDVKPNLQDLKPQLASDGKVACLQCTKRVHRNLFSSHVHSDHLPGGNPYQCLHCPENFRSRGQLAKHQSAAHGVQTTAETFSCSITKELVRDWIKLCFGETKHMAFAGSKCRRCDSSVRLMDQREHIAKKHLKKALFRYCAF